MISLISVFNTIFSALTLISQIAIVGLVAFYFVRPRSRILSVVADRAYPLAWLVALGATGISLFYSDILGFEPCKLCWLQRVFMYPLVVLFSVSLIKKEKAITDYVIWLSLIGLAIAVYQYYGQMFNASIFSCGLSAAGSSCAQRFFVEFGYITIPMMSLTSFALILLFMFLEKKRDKHY